MSNSETKIESDTNPEIARLRRDMDDQLALARAVAKQMDSLVQRLTWTRSPWRTAGRPSACRPARLFP
jgi:hypothetical protein